MKPDAYMPYYGNDFEAATKSFTPATKWAYLCAIWHYWHHTHCAGLPDDDDSLRRICEVEMADWARIRGRIFVAPFFEKNGDGLWHQKKSRSIYSDWAEAYQRRCVATAKARQAKASESTPESDTDTDTDTVLDSRLNQNQNQNQNQKPLVQHTHKGAPSLDQVLAKAGMVGVTAEDAEKFFHHFESVGWVDKNGHEIKRWESRLIKWKMDNQARPVEQAAKASQSRPHGPDATDRIQGGQELERIMKRIASMENGAALDAMGKKYYTPQDLETLRALRARRKELRDKLGIKF